MTLQLRTSQQQQAKSPHFFCVSGLPELYDWKQLKDLVRIALDSEPGWTNTIVQPNGFAGFCGYISIRTEQDAEKAWNFLSRGPIFGKRLNVHQWICSETTCTFQRCNCSEVFPQNTAGHLAIGVAITDQMVTQMFCQVPSSALPVPLATFAARNVYVGPQPRVQLPTYPSYAIPQASMAFPAYQIPAQSYNPTQFGSSYKGTSTGIPVNTSNGTVRTESRGVFIQNISFHIKQAELEKMIKQIAKPVKCRFLKDPSSGRFKGHATVLFGSANDAEKVIRVLDGKEYRNSILSVRLDRETTTVEPFVVSSDTHSDARQSSRRR